MKTRKYKNARKRKTSKRGGTIYSVGQHRNYNYYYDKAKFNTETPTATTAMSSDIQKPYIFADILKNVSIHPNTDKNYKYYGFLMMEIKNPLDLETIKLSLEKYLTENVTTDPKFVNQMKIGLNYDQIKIFDFKFSYNNEKEKGETQFRSHLTSPITITGSIYVYDVERLSKNVEKKLLTNLPGDIVNREIKEYI